MNRHSFLILLPFIHALLMSPPLVNSTTLTSCTCHCHLDHTHYWRRVTGRMTEEITLRQVGRDRYGVENENPTARGCGSGYDKLDNRYTYIHNNNNNRNRNQNQNKPGPGRPILNPKAGSFFSTYTMSEALPTLHPLPQRVSGQAIPPTDFRPPPLTKPIRIAPPPLSPVPYRSHSRALVVQQPTSNVRNDLDPTPYPHQNSYAMLGDRTYDCLENINSTTLHVGPIPPSFTIDQMHTALRGFNPRLALFDIRLGIIEVEIPFTLNWAQVRDWCERGLVIGGVTIQVRSAQVPNRNRAYA